MSKTVELRFHGGLQDFLPADTTPVITRTFDVPGSVKDLIESCGVPHTEVGAIVVNGRAVEFSHRVEDGDVVAVYPPGYELSREPETWVAPPPLPELRFVLDVHLGSLARYLRLLGFDSSWESGSGDKELVRIATAENRLLLTRDVGLLMHGALVHGYYVRASDGDTQLREVVQRFDLGPVAQPFTRCMVCNTKLDLVDKGLIADLLPPETRRHFDEFQRCMGCDRIYWKGSHYQRLRRLVDRVLE